MCFCFFGCGGSYHSFGGRFCWVLIGFPQRYYRVPVPGAYTVYERVYRSSSRVLDGFCIYIYVYLYMYVYIYVALSVGACKVSERV